MNLTVDHVTFAYTPDVIALRDVSLTVGTGESVAIIGANGAGKTTLVKHLNGLLTPTRGRVLVGQRDTAQHSVAQLAHAVGFVFQNPDEQLFKRTVRAEVAFGPNNLGFDDVRIDATVAAALEAVGLLEAADTHPYDLSTSQRKMVALASILAMETPVLILDEPTIGQDQRGLARLGEIITRLKADGRTVITISHDIDFCADHFARLIVMSDGRILADASAETVVSHPDILTAADVSAPQLVQLGAALDLPGVPLSVEAFVAALKAAQHDS